jgi:hypothetical protein
VPVGGVGAEDSKSATASVKRSEEAAGLPYTKVLRVIFTSPRRLKLAWRQNAGGRRIRVFSRANAVDGPLLPSTQRGSDSLTDHRSRNRKTTQCRGFVP